jgi:hypothetical protein
MKYLERYSSGRGDHTSVPYLVSATLSAVVVQDGGMRKYRNLRQP